MGFAHLAAVAETSGILMTASIKIRATEGIYVVINDAPVAVIG